jgi:hypothetical protein
MRRYLWPVLCTSVLIAGAEINGAPKPKGTPASAQFNGTMSIIGGAYDGVLDRAFSGSWSDSSQTICFRLDFSSESSDDSLEPVAISTAGDEVGPSWCFRLTGLHVHGVTNLPLSPNFAARQMGIGFVDARGYAYSLQFGDAYVNPPDYTRGTCLVATNGSCTSASIDSAEGTYPGQSGEPRITGDQARLSVQIGRKKPVILDIFNVPFQLTITASS